MTHRAAGGVTRCRGDLEPLLSAQGVHEVHVAGNEGPLELVLGATNHGRSAGHHSPAVGRSMVDTPTELSAPVNGPRSGKCPRAGVFRGAAPGNRCAVASPQPSHTAMKTSSGVVVALASTSMSALAVNVTSSIVTPRPGRGRRLPAGECSELNEVMW